MIHVLKIYLGFSAGHAEGVAIDQFVLMRSISVHIASYNMCISYIAMIYS